MWYNELAAAGAREVKIMSDYDSLTIVIPSLDPDERLLEVIKGVREKGFHDILLVDDGSAPQNQHWFEEARRDFGCVVLRHPRNLGKGRALKTAFEWLKENRPRGFGCVTIDGDNQHHPDDIAACADRSIKEEGKALVIGARDFSAKDIPPKSRFGNRFTSFVFRVFCGLKVSDTQTGLRVIPSRLYPLMLEISGERFEYETNMLLRCKTENIPIVEQTIRTIYIDDNKATHFHPVKDSLRVYGIIIRFCLSSILAFLVDYGLFNLFYDAVFRNLSFRLSLSTALARVISSVVNFTVNRKAVFHSSAPLLSTTVKYYILCVLQLLTSIGLLKLLSMLFGQGSFIMAVLKLAVDITLYFISFRVQNYWVFRQKKPEDA